MIRGRRWGARIYLGLIFLFLYAPIIVMIAFSFNSTKSRVNWTGFTFKWYKELFHNDLIMESFFNTLLVAFCASLLATLIGTIASFGIVKMKRVSRRFIENVTYVPIINPEIVTGVSLMLLFVIFNRAFSFPFGFVSVLFAHVTFCLPYVILSVLPKLRQADHSLVEAAQDLGCTHLQALRKVMVPEILPGIITGALISFTYSLDDFVISYFTNGSTFQTLPITIFSMTRKKVTPQINALSAIIFVVVLAVLIIMNISESKQLKNKNLRR